MLPSSDGETWNLVNLLRGISCKLIVFFHLGFAFGDHELSGRIEGSDKQSRWRSGIQNVEGFLDIVTVETFGVSQKDGTLCQTSAGLMERDGG